MNTQPEVNLNTSLSSLALLSLQMGEGNDYLDYLHGFVIEALHQIKTASFDAAAIQEIIRKEFGLRIPVATLAIYLKRLQKGEIVKPTVDGYQFQIIKLPKSSILNDRKAAAGRITEVLQKLREYVLAQYNLTWTEEQTAAALNEFVQKYSIVFVRHTEFRSPLPDPGAETASEHFIVASFVKNCAENVPAVFDSVKTLVESHILANALLCPDLKDKGTGFKNVNFVLDTRLLLKALDLEATIDTENTRGLLDSVRRLGGVLCVFPETKEELRSVLNGITRGFQMGGAKGPVVEELRKRGRGIADVILAESKLEELLKKLYISTLASPSYDATNYRFQIDEAALRAELEEELGYMLGRAADHDIHVVRSIFALRRGRRVSRIEDCGYVFLTTNTALSRAAFHQQKEENDGWVFSAVITDFHLSHLTWLKNPAQAGDLARTELLSSCYAAMHPPQNVWKAYLAEVDRLKAEGRFSEQDHEVLRLSLKAPNELMEVTRGQVEGITESNLRTILKRLERTYAAEKDKEIADLRLQQERIHEELKLTKQSSEKRDADLSEAAAREQALLNEKKANEQEIQRLKAFQDELIKKQTIADLLVRQDSRMKNEVNIRGENPEHPVGHPRWVLPTAIVFGVLFVLVLLAIAIFIPNPTKFQEFVFRVVLSLAAAGVGAALPGFLHVKMPLWGKGLISAGGALALFVVIYQINPPALISNSSIGEMPSTPAITNAVSAPVSK